MEAIKISTLLRSTRTLSPGDLRRLVVTQSPVKTICQTDVKNSQGVIIIKTFLSGNRGRWREVIPTTECIGNKTILEQYMATKET